MMVFAFNLVESQPPFQTNQNTELGLQIFFTPFEYMTQNKDFNFHIHVSNITNGYPVTNTFVSCYVHLYNTTGDHTLESDVLIKDANLYDHEIFIDKGNFSDLGDHSIYIWCNNSDVGGGAKESYEVTINGQPNNLNAYIFLFILASSLITTTVLINIKFNQQKREALYKKIVVGYFNVKSNEKNNLGTVILYVLAYGLLNLLFGFYYLEFVFLLYVLTEWALAFNMVSFITIFSTWLSISMWGFILVFIVIFFIFFEMFKNLLNDISDSMWGMTK